MGYGVGVAENAPNTTVVNVTANETTGNGYRQ